MARPVVYLLHFDRPYVSANGKGIAGHYLGSTSNLKRRLAEHAAGRGARLLAVAAAAGIGWQLARLWPGCFHQVFLAPRPQVGVAPSDRQERESQLLSAPPAGARASCNTPGRDSLLAAKSPAGVGPERLAKRSWRSPKNLVRWGRNRFAETPGGRARERQLKRQGSRARLCPLCGITPRTLPVNRDGSVSRSLTTDPQKAAAGLMTAAQLAEHTALRYGAVTGKPARPAMRGPALVDVWAAQPAGSLPRPVPVTRR